MNHWQTIFANLTYRGPLQPSRDWFTLLILSFFILVGMAAWSAWLFDHVARGGTLTETATSTSSVFDQAALREVEKVFTDRAAREKAYTDGTHRFIDPSK